MSVSRNSTGYKVMGKTLPVRKATDGLRRRDTYSRLAALIIFARRAAARDERTSHENTAETQHQAGPWARPFCNIGRA
jgi:hypothetical protein